MARQPNYSIKLVSPEHFAVANPQHRHDYDQTPLMNFSTNGNCPAIATSIREGDCAIVYEMTPRQRFTHAIEYLGTVADGQRIATTQGLAVGGEWGTNVLPIRFLAHVEDWAVGPTADEIERLTGFVFKPNAYPMRSITPQEYQAIFHVLQSRTTRPA